MLASRRPILSRTRLRRGPALLAALALGAFLPQAATTGAVPTFGTAGARATSALLRVFYAGAGLWRLCSSGDCGSVDQDWGADSLTYTLALRAETGAPAPLIGLLGALAARGPSYPAPCNGGACASWSDVPEWDAIALARAYEATGSPAVLAKAEAAFGFVEGSSVFSLGACPAIRYQQPYGGANHLKTLETDANAIKAALLLYHDSREARYLESARRHYDAVRRYFLDPRVPLYSTYVFDDGRRCVQLPHRFFASVNGDMIWNGLELFRDSSRRRYLAEALATAHALDTHLADSRGIFTDLQAENDVVEPLVEGMYALATEAHAGFARRWILRNAAAALGARAASGAFGRFFDGPPPTSTVTAWQTNGGFALEIAAAALAPHAAAIPTPGWGDAVPVTREISGTPAVLSFRGEGVALIGTLGERCCESGHVRLVLDGRETFDRTGIWQDKSSAGRALPGSILFAWRWPHPGEHTLRFEAAAPNGKEGVSFVHVRSYLAIPG